MINSEILQRHRHNVFEAAIKQLSIAPIGLRTEAVMVACDVSIFAVNLFYLEFSGVSLPPAIQTK